MLENSAVPESNTATTGNRENDEGGGSVSVGSGEEERVGGGAEEGGGDRSFGGNRWPRQETLAMLKIRSDMDDAFRDASSKAPLWEQVSRSVTHSHLIFFFAYSLFDSWEILKDYGLCKSLKYKVDVFVLLLHEWVWLEWRFQVQSSYLVTSGPK